MDAPKQPAAGSGLGWPSLLGGRILNTPNLSPQKGHPPGGEGRRWSRPGAGAGRGRERRRAAGKRRLNGGRDSGEAAAAKGNEERGRWRKTEGGTVGGETRPGGGQAGAPGPQGEGATPSPESALARGGQGPAGAWAGTPAPGAAPPSPGRVDARPAVPPGLTQTWAASAGAKTDLARCAGSPHPRAFVRPTGLRSPAPCPLPARPRRHTGAGAGRPGRRGRRAARLTCGSVPTRPRLGPGPPARPAERWAGPPPRTCPARPARSRQPGEPTGRAAARPRAAGP